MVGGFSEWAHVRLRDQSPGPMSYTPQPPKIPHRSILGKYNTRAPDITVGPGEYQIPSTVGDCRSTLIGPPHGPPAVGDTVTAAKGSGESPPRGNRRKRRMIGPLPKQYSLALMPDSPAFSIYAKLHNQPPSISVGPGDYNIPSEFSVSRKGAHLGQRTRLMNACDNVPGPGTYNVPRFGDETVKRKEYITAIRRVHEENLGPGPGSYDDPNTISARFTKPKRHLYDGPRFGGRYPKRSGSSDGPSPAEYGNVSCILTERPTHTPIFHPPCHLLPPNKSVHAARNTAPGPGNYCIPSEFDQHYPKGVSFGTRLQREPKRAVSDAIGPGHYELGKPPMTSNGFRFAARPFDPLAAHGSTSRAQGSESAATLGPGVYNPNLDSVRPSKYRSVSGFGLGNRFPEAKQPGLHCYNVKPPDTGRSTVFYRGDYNRCKYVQG